MTYVDGYILAVPTENLGAYRDMADKAGKIWMEHGALEYKECVAENIDDKGFPDYAPSSANSCRRTNR